MVAFVSCQAVVPGLAFSVCVSFALAEPTRPQQLTNKKRTHASDVRATGIPSHLAAAGKASPVKAWVNSKATGIENCARLDTNHHLPESN
jgi:ethanolamine ammonia-lyase small subunit